MVQSADFLLVGSVFTCATHPELIVHQRTTTHNACWEFGITIRTNLAPMKDENEKITPGKKISDQPFYQTIHNIQRDKRFIKQTARKLCFQAWLRNLVPC